jgi:dephospho-CoA kinase
VCSTIAPLHIREKRALQRVGLKKKIFKQIIKNQAKDKERKEKSDYLINTTLTQTKTCLQVDNIIYDLLNKKK